MTSLVWDSKVRKEAENGGYHRIRSADLYHSYRWTRLSRTFRAAHPLCAECARSGRIKAAEVVDHIVPYPVCRDFFDEANLQSLCADCNAAKGNRDKAAIAEWRRGSNAEGVGGQNLSADFSQDHAPSFEDARAENRHGKYNKFKLK